MGERTGQCRPNYFCTVTKGAVEACQWCRRPLPPRAATGRPRRFCQPACRQRAYEARRLASSLHLGVGEVVVAKAELDQLHDRLYVLEAALEDVAGDLAGSPPAVAYREAFLHLYEAAAPLRGVVVEGSPSALVVDV